MQPSGFNKPGISKGLTLYNDPTKVLDDYDYDDEEGDTISEKLDKNSSIDSTKNKLTMYKSGSIHSKQVYNILKKRPIEQLGQTFKVKAGKIYLDMGETQQNHFKPVKKKLIETDDFVKNINAFVPMKMKVGKKKKKLRFKSTLHDDTMK